MYIHHLITGGVCLYRFHLTFRRRRRRCPKANRLTWQILAASERNFEDGELPIAPRRKYTPTLQVWVRGRKVFRVPDFTRLASRLCRYTFVLKERGCVWCIDARLDAFLGECEISVYT